MSKLQTYHIATHVTDMGSFRSIHVWNMCISHLRLDKRQRRRLKRSFKKKLMEQRATT